MYLLHKEQAQHELPASVDVTSFGGIVSIILTPAGNSASHRHDPFPNTQIIALYLQVRLPIDLPGSVVVIEAFAWLKS